MAPEILSMREFELPLSSLACEAAPGEDLEEAVAAAAAEMRQESHPRADFSDGYITPPLSL